MDIEDRVATVNFSLVSKMRHPKDYVREQRARHSRVGREEILNLAKKRNSKDENGRSKFVILRRKEKKG